ncbi:MAG: hypothetical protein ABI811_13375 [Acidobacteriota bacterium]
MQMRLWTVGVAATVFMIGLANGQTLQRRANVTAGGSPDRGECRIEVTVDGAAEVEIRGGNATLRNLSGQTPQWRRFDCTGTMPANPANLRFTGLDGRGRQELVRGPQNGGAMVVRIQDPDGGADGYAFAVTWGSGNQPYSNFPGGNPAQPSGRGGGGSRYTTEQAIRVCQDAIRQQVLDRYRNASVAFRNTALDNNPGRQDWITGLLDIRRGYDRDETHSFSCSVNFDTGAVRSAQLEPLERDRYMPGYGDARKSAARIAMDSCQVSVEANLYQRGYQHVDFLAINVDNRPGRNDWIVGDARADIRNRSDSFTFSCSVDFRDGDVRSVDVRRR